MVKTVELHVTHVLRRSSLGPYGSANCRTMSEAMPSLGASGGAASGASR